MNNQHITTAKIMPPVGLKREISASDRPHILAFDPSTTGNGALKMKVLNMHMFFKQIVQINDLFSTAVGIA
jgi:hypothetical protein